VPTTTTFLFEWPTCETCPTSTTCTTCTTTRTRSIRVATTRGERSPERSILSSELERSWLSELERSWSSELERSWLSKLERSWLSKLERSWSSELETTRGESPRRLDPPRLPARFPHEGEQARPHSVQCLGRPGGIETPAPFSPTRRFCGGSCNSRWTSRFQRRAYLRPSARHGGRARPSDWSCDASRTVCSVVVAEEKTPAVPPEKPDA
jgi:hypothetical protein